MHPTSQLTTELVIQSEGAYTLDDVYANVTASDIYNVQPQLGFYCLYRARPNRRPAFGAQNHGRAAGRYSRLYFLQPDVLGAAQSRLLDFLPDQPICWARI